MSDTPTAIITPIGTAAWPHLFTAVLPRRAKPTDKPKFSLTILFTEAAMNTPEGARLKQEVVNCGIAKWGEQKFTAMVNEGVVKMPFRRDVTTKGYPEHFKCFVNMTSGADFPPAVVDRYLDPATGKAKAITDPRLVVSGTEVRASVSCRAYGGPGTEFAAGIAIDLRNVQRVGDGTPLKLGAASDPDSDFGPAEPSPAGAAASGEKSLADLMG
jgi:hypothetical protein